MSSDRDVETLLRKAGDEEKRYRWFEAANIYEEIMSSRQLATSHVPEVYETVGFCYGRASTQSKNLKKFKILRQKALKAYKTAAQLLEQEGSLNNQGKAAECRAIAEYLGSWVASNLAEKRKKLQNCRRFGKRSLAAYKRAGDESSYGKMRNNLLMFLLENLYIASDQREQRIITEEGINHTDKAAEALSKLDNKSQLRFYYTASLCCGYAANICEEEERRKELSQKSLTYSKKALELSRKANDPYCIAMSRWAAASNTLHFIGDVEIALNHAREMLKQSMIAKDNYLRGVANYFLAFATNWMALKEGDPNRKREALKRAIKSGENAIRYLKRVGQDFFTAQTYLFYVDSYSNLASDMDARSKEREDTLEKAVETGRKGLEHATRSGSPDALGSTLHALSKALHSHSNRKVGRREKTKLLEESLIHRKEYNIIVEKAFRSNDWVRGVGKYYEGLIEADLAELETDKEKKRFPLERAASDMEEGISHCRRAILSRPVPAYIASVGRFEDRLGGVLTELYLMAEDQEIARKAIEIYEDAAKNFNRASLPSRAAESYWKIARYQDKLGSHEKAAGSFESASKMYLAAAQKIPHSEEFYKDHALYMQAWNEIERARYSHAKQEYDRAKKHYAKAASLHKTTKSWNYLAPNYLAWTQLEQAEGQSRDDQSQEAIHSFQKASKLFLEAKRALRLKSDRIENADEKDLVESLMTASDIRHQYCLGRIALEKARILDRQGDHLTSSKKYGSAADVLQKAAKLGSKRNQIELLPIVLLCQAWQKMMMAEAKTSSRMYGEAAELFQQAKEHALDQQTSLLALANSSFCKALESGTEFEATREPSLHLAAAQHLENAANYYRNAGINTASEYAKATQRLFDAYIYLDAGKKEADPERKVRYYMMAEKVLQTSAGSYLKAKHMEKSTQVQRLLEKIKEDRELASSLSEVLHAPAITSSTASFVTPTHQTERAVGLERFERASILTNLVLHAKKLKVGEDFSLKMQIVNVGKEVVLLTKIEEAFPPGFDLVDQPDYCSWENGHLTIKGKRVNPLNAEEIRLVLRSFDKGAFEIKPKLVYVDETGHQIASEPDPVTFEVSEVVLPDRIKTGYKDLDSLLFGGIPENYAVILTSASCDERDLLIKRFLEAGVKEGQITFFVTIKPTGMEDLANEFQSNFFVFICNPQADVIAKSLPNVSKLKGVENLTEINIALTSAFRRLDVSPTSPRRICIEIISDVLLQHQTVNTRRWLNALIPELKSKGFTALAVMNTQMHSSEEVQAILGLFEGEISIFEKETMKGLKKLLKIRKMYNQKYLETELSLRKNRLHV